VQRSGSVKKPGTLSLWKAQSGRIYSTFIKISIQAARAMFVKLINASRGCIFEPLDSRHTPKADPRTWPGLRKARSTESIFAPRAGARGCRFFPGGALHPGLHPARTPGPYLCCSTGPWLHAGSTTHPSPQLVQPLSSNPNSLHGGSEYRPCSARCQLIWRPAAVDDLTHTADRACALKWVLQDTFRKWRP
jgi:hypothetical protein